MQSGRHTSMRLHPALLSWLSSEQATQCCFALDWRPGSRFVSHCVIALQVWRASFTFFIVQDVMVSGTLQVTYRQLAYFFTDADLAVTSTHSNSTLPPLNTSVSLLKAMALGPQPITTFALIKPDGMPFWHKILLRLEHVCVHLLGLALLSHLRSFDRLD